MSMGLMINLIDEDGLQRHRCFTLYDFQFLVDWGGICSLAALEFPISMRGESFIVLKPFTVSVL